MLTVRRIHWGPRKRWTARLAGVLIAAQLLAVLVAVGPAHADPVASGPLPQPDYNPAAVANPTPTVSIGGSPAGGTPGSFSVGDNGEASYEVPLQLVPGRGGFQPNLSLRYRSGVGNGPLGVGFTLSGLSHISRCAKTVADDGISIGVRLDATDRFCLGGQRLVAVSGSYGAHDTEYRTRPSSHVRVRSYKTAFDADGPTQFTVWLPDGTIQEYGGPATSKVFAGDGHYVNTAWHLSKARDRSGNVISYEYATRIVNDADHLSEVERWIGRISYGNGSKLDRRVEFIHDNRPDLFLGYAFGERRESTKRLIEIRMSADVGGWKRARSYTLEYENVGATKASKLRRIRECGTVANECKTPTTFFWWYGVEGLQAPQTQTSSTGAPLVPSSEESQIVAADFTGDGRTDLAWPEGNNSGEQPVWKHVDASFLGDYRVVHDGAFNPYGRSATAFSMDYDNDGAVDLIPRESQSQPYRPILSRPGSVHRQAKTTFAGGFNRVDSAVERLGGMMGDFDGDGYQDVLEYRESKNTPEPDYEWGWRRRTGDVNPKIDDALPFDDRAFGPSIHLGWLFGLLPSNAFAADLDGDGRDELLWKQSGPNGSLFASDLYTFTHRQIPGLDSTLVTTDFVFVDVNGDGLLDVLHEGIAAADKGLLFHKLNTGRGFLPSTGTSISFPTGALKAAKVLDYNGDGWQDLLLPRWNGVAYVGMDVVRAVAGASLGITLHRGATPVEFTGRSLASLIVQGPRVVDADGDGQDDVLLVDRPATGAASLRLWRHAGGVMSNTDYGTKPDLLREVTDGNQMPQGPMPPTVHITYAPLTDLAVYRRGDCPRVPHQGCLAGPTHVVKQVVSDAGLNDYPTFGITSRYEYRNGRVDKKARAFLGFAEKLVHTNTGIGDHGPNLHRTFYSNTVPRKDPRPKETWAVNSLPGGKYSLQRTNLNWAERAITGSYFDYVGSTLERSYEYAVTSCVPCHADWTTHEFDGLGKPPYASVTEAVMDIDEYGNPLYVLAQWTDADQSSSLSGTNVTPAIDTAEWLVNRPGKVIVQDQRNDNIKTRTVDYVYKPKTNLVSQRKTYGASTATGPVRLDNFDYDAEGNVIRTKSTDAGTGESVESTAIYDPYGYPHATMNGLGHITRTGHDPVTGWRKAIVDVNGLRSDLTYDSLGRMVKSRTPTGAETTIAYSIESMGEDHLIRARTSDGTGAVSEVVADRMGRPVVERFKGFDGVMREQQRRYTGEGLLRSRTLPRPVGATGNPDKLTYGYDDLGRMTSQTDPEGGVQSWTYDRLSVTYTAANGHRTQAFGNARGETVRVVDGLGTTAETARQHTYGPFGNLVKTLVEGVPASTDSFGYDELGNQVSSANSERGPTVNTFNAFGEVVTSTDAIGRKTTIKRDALRRVTEQTVVQNGVGRSSRNYFYDQFSGGTSRKGKLLRSVLYEAGDYTFITNSYDNLSRLTAVEYTLPVEDDPGDLDLEETLRVGYSYDPYNRLTGVTYPTLPGRVTGTSVSYEYAGNGRLATVKVAQPASEAATLWTAKATDAQDRLVHHDSGDGTRTTRNLNWQGAARDLTVTTSAADVDPSRELFAEEYAYDLVGNLTMRGRRNAGSVDQRELFGYDALDRVNSLVLSLPPVSGSGPPVNTQADAWTYDKLGNIVTSKRRGTYTYDTFRPTRVTSVTGGIFGNRGYGYDAVGNQITRPEGKVDFNDFDLPSKITSGTSGTSTFLYHPDGTRARKITGAGIVTYVPGRYERHRTASKTQHRLLVPADGGTVATLVYDQQPGAQTVTRQPTLYPHGDRISSTSVVTANSAATGLKATVKEQRSYDTFGKLRSPDWRLGDAGYTQGIEPATLDRGYTGHPDDRETDLVNMGGRMYDPTLGKFLTPDPNVDGANPSQAWNGYTYVSNNPHRYTDPTGFRSCLDHCSLPDHVMAFAAASQMFWSVGAWGFSPVSPNSPEGGQRFENEIKRYYEQQYRRDFESQHTPTAENTATIEGTETPQDTLTCTVGASGPECTGVGVAPEQTIVGPGVNDFGRMWCGPGVPCGYQDQLRAETWATQLDEGMDALLEQIALNALDAYLMAGMALIEAEALAANELVLWSSAGKHVPPSAVAGAVKKGIDLRGVSDPLSIVPSSAQARALTPHADPARPQHGLEFKWTEPDGSKVTLRVHDRDLGAPVGSNAHGGWTYRVQIGKQYQDVEGNLFHHQMHNPDSPNYNPSAADATHIPYRLFRPSGT